MLDEILFLTPDAADGPDADQSLACELAPTNPPVMIPGINPDGTLYPIEKIEAHVKGAHHLALSVFIFDGEELLLQRRALGKYHCGGQWANTCCTHPHMDEDISEAAARRLDEELGISLPVEKKRVVEYSADVGGGLWERERVHMFRAEIAKADLVYDLNPEEVAEIRWITPAKLLQEMAETPEAFTPWFCIYVDRFPELDF